MWKVTTLLLSGAWVSAAVHQSRLPGDLWILAILFTFAYIGYDLGKNG
jgi:hypothetical protein